MFESITAALTQYFGKIQPTVEVLTPGPGSSPQVGSTDMMTARPVPRALVIDRKTMRLPKEQYLQEVYPKTCIALHFTAGTTARSAFNSWISDARRVGTAYILDVDGSVYEAFPPEHWAGHLGE